MSYALGNCKPWVVSAANEIGPKFGIRTVYGYSYRNIAGTNTLSDHARGLALDFMCGIPTGDQLAAYVQANAGRLGVTYVIHNRRIWSVARSREGWRTYSGVNPHTDHVHVSFADHAGTGGAANASNAGWLGGVPLPIIPHLGKGGGPGLPVGPGGVDPSGNTVAQVWEALKSVSSMVAFLTNPAAWIRLLLFLAGLALLALAVASILDKQGGGVAQAATKTGKTVAHVARTTAKAAK